MGVGGGFSFSPQAPGLVTVPYGGVRLGNSGIRIYSGIGKFSFAKRTIISDILMRLLSVTRKTQLIFFVF